MILLIETAAACSAIAAVRGTGGEIAVALAGGHGQLFVQTFGEEEMRPLDTLRSLPPVEAAEAIRAHRVAARGWCEAIETLPRAADARLLPPALRALAARPIHGRGPDAKPMS